MALRSRSGRAAALPLSAAALVMAAAACTAPATVLETTITGPSGASLFVRQIGTGPHVVVVPLAYWNQEQFERIAEGRTFVFYDPRGRRRSTPVKGPGEFGVDADLADLDAAIRHTGATRVSLVGSSYYGAIVARYAMTHAERVESLVMVSPLYLRREPHISTPVPGASTRRDPAAMQAFSKLRDAGLEQTDPERYCLEYWKVEGAMTVVDLATLAGRKWPCELPNEWPSRTSAWGQAVFASLGNWDWTEDVKRLNVPALVVQGDQDLMTPRAASQEWATLLPNARLEIIPRGGAVLWWERADVLFPIVDRFLRDAVTR